MFTRNRWLITKHRVTSPQATEGGAAKIWRPQPRGSRDQVSGPKIINKSWRIIVVWLMVDPHLWFFHDASGFWTFHSCKASNATRQQPAGLLRFSRAQSPPILWAHVGIILVKLKKKTNNFKIIIIIITTYSRVQAQRARKLDTESPRSRHGHHQ